MQVRRFWSVPHVERRGAELALLIALAALLELAAGVGLAYVAGFSQVRAVVGDVHWGWLAVLAWAAERYQDRFRGRPGWRGAMGIFLEAAHLIRELFLRLRWGMKTA